MKTIKTIDFINNIDNPEYKIIDIRDKLDFLKSNIPNSINIPYTTLKSKYKKFLNLNEKYYIICTKGMTSIEITSFLNNHGYNAVSVIGGYNAYISLANGIHFHKYY